MSSRRAEFASAFGLLTRLPVATFAAPGQPGDTAKSVWAYPLAGVVIGGIGGATYWLIHALGATPLIAGVFAFGIMVLATGGLHEDGAADTADGLGGGSYKERKLEIMRDSRIGSYGVIALVLIFALRLAAVDALADAAIVSATLIATATLSRGAMGPLMLILRPARSEGMAARVGRPSRTSTLEGLAVTAVICVLMLPLGTAIVAMVAAAFGAAAVGLVARIQISGQTGDIIGAAGIAAECAALTAIVAIAG